MTVHGLGWSIGSGSTLGLASVKMVARVESSQVKSLPNFRLRSKRSNSNRRGGGYEVFFARILTKVPTTLLVLNPPMFQNPPPWIENFRELIKPKSSRLRRRRKILKPTLPKMRRRRKNLKPTLPKMRRRRRILKPTLLKMRCGEKFWTCARSAQKKFRGLLGGFLKI